MNVKAIVEAINSDFSGGFYQGYALYDASNPTSLVGITFAYLPGYDTPENLEIFISGLITTYASGLGHSITDITWPRRNAATGSVDGLFAAADKNTYDGYGATIAGLSASVSALQSAVSALQAVPATTVTSQARSIVTGTGATGFRPSATRDVFATYSLTIATTSTIGSNASGTVFLETAPTNSATPSDWVEVARFTNGQAVSLALTLQSVQTLAGAISGMIPSGYYAKLRSVNNVGTPVFTFNSGREVLL